MKILVRLPNWLGDMVMATAFMEQLPFFFPGAEISVIAKKGIHELLPFFPPINDRFIFNKVDYNGIKGLIKFGKEIKARETFDFFFTLPNSFSSALMGFATGSLKRIGYKYEWRQLLLTEAYKRKEGLHRVEEYIRLLELHTGRMASAINVSLRKRAEKNDHLVVNINSEASSRRLTPSKAIELLSLLRKSVNNKIYLIGAPNEIAFVEYVLSQLKDNHNMHSLAGKTSLPELADVIASAKAVLTTDSGPAHLSNALGTFTFVLFGAGNECITRPYNSDLSKIIRLGELSCEPCEKNTCMRYETPQCLERLKSQMIVNNITQYLER